MNRELDAQVAERIMGYRWELSWNGGCRVLMPADEIQMPAPDTLKLCTDWKRYVPTYSTDLNACAQAEARVIGMGLGDLYAQTLEASIRADLYAADGYWAGWRAALLTASAEARCRAMLQVVGEGA